MTAEHTPKDNDFVRWMDEKSEIIKDDLAEKLSVTTAVEARQLAPQGRDLEEVLLGHEEPTEELLREIADLEAAPALSEEELARQAMADGGADDDIHTPE